MSAFDDLWDATPAAPAATAPTSFDEMWDAIPAAPAAAPGPVSITPEMGAPQFQTEGPSTTRVAPGYTGAPKGVEFGQLPVRAAKDLALGVTGTVAGAGGELQRFGGMAPDAGQKLVKPGVALLTKYKIDDSFLKDDKSLDLKMLRAKGEEVGKQFTPKESAQILEALRTQYGKAKAPEQSVIKQFFDVSGKAVEEYSKEMKETYKVDDPGALDEVLQGVGSSAVFLAPGLGIARGTSILGAMAPRVAAWAGISASSAAESMIEAGNKYTEELEKTGDENAARIASDKVFFADLATLLVTNKLGGIFDKMPFSVKQSLISMGAEATEEGLQQVWSNVASKDPFMKDVYKSAALGAIISGPAAIVTAVSEHVTSGKQPVPGTMADRAGLQPVEQTDTMPPTTTPTDQQQNQQQNQQPEQQQQEQQQEEQEEENIVAKMDLGTGEQTIEQQGQDQTTETPAEENTPPAVWSFTVNGRQATRRSTSERAAGIATRNPNLTTEQAYAEAYEQGKEPITGVESIDHFNEWANESYAGNRQDDAIQHFHLHGDEMADAFSWVGEDGKTKRLAAKGDINYFGSFNESKFTGHEWTDELNTAVQRTMREALHNDPGMQNAKTDAEKVRAFVGTLAKVKAMFNNKIQITLPNGEGVPLGISFGVSMDPNVAETMLNTGKKNFGPNTIAIDNALKNEYGIYDNIGEDITEKYWNAGLRSQKLEAAYGKLSGKKPAATGLGGVSGAENATTGSSGEGVQRPGGTETDNQQAATAGVKPPKKPVAGAGATKPPKAPPPVASAQGQQESASAGQKKRKTPITQQKYEQPTGTDLTYVPVSERETLEKAEKIIESQGMDGAENALSDTKTEESVKTALAISLANKLQQEAQETEGEAGAAKMQKAMRIVSEHSRRLTELGRAIDAVKVLSILSPENAAIYAQHRIDQNNKNSKESPTLSKEDAKTVTDFAKKGQEYGSLKSGADKIGDILKDAKAGKKLTTEQVQTIKDYRDELAKVLGPEQRVEQKATKKKYHPRSTESMRSHAKAVRDAALARIQESIKKRSSSVSMDLAPRELPDYAMVGYSYIVEGAANLADFSARMVETFGEDIQPYLGRLYNTANAMFKQDVARERSMRRALRGIDKMVAETPQEHIAELRKYIDMVANSSQEARTQSLAGIEAVIESGKYTKSTIMGKVQEAWINFLLSGPPTHVANITGNIARTLYEPLKTMTTASEQAAAAPFRKGKRDVFFGEVPAELAGIAKGTVTGLQKAVEAFITNKPSAGSTKTELPRAPQIKGIKGEIVRAPGRALLAADEFFKEIARTMDNHAQAYRQVQKAVRSGELTADEASAEIAHLIANPTADMQEHAEKIAKQATFQEDLPKFLQDVMRVRESHPWTKFIVPFMKTPANVMKFVFENTPAGFIPAAIKASKGELTSEQISEEFAKPIIGTSLMAAAASMAAAGLITGFGPRDKEKRQLKYNTGWRPYSIKTPDGYVEYGRIEPFSSILGLGADLYELSQEESIETTEDAIKAAAQTVSNAFVSKTFLSGVSNAIKAMSDPEREFESWYKQFVGSVVPAAVGVTARAIDPTVRRTESVTDVLQARIPYASARLFPKRDVWGGQIDRPGVFWTRLLSPMQYSALKGDAFDQEMVDIGADIGVPQDKVSLDDAQRKELKTRAKNIALTPAEYDQFVKLAGADAKQAVKTVMGTAEYQAADKEGKADSVKKAYNNTIETYREAIRRVAIEREKTKGDGEEFTVREIATRLKAAPVGLAIEKYTESDNMNWRRAAKIVGYSKLSAEERSALKEMASSREIAAASRKARDVISTQQERFNDRIKRYRVERKSGKLTRSEYEEKMREIRSEMKEFRAVTRNKQP